MVGIILYGPFELAPYAKAYMQMLDGMDIKYDLIGWRRGDAAEYEGENVYIYCGKTAKRFSTPIHKLLPTVKYRRFVKRLIRKKKYDMLIILTTQTAMILPDVLLGRYSGRYIFDYRDKSYEYIKLYRALVNAFARHSKETAVSSPWFAENLTDTLSARELVESEGNGWVCANDDEEIAVCLEKVMRSFSPHKNKIEKLDNADAVWLFNSLVNS